MRKTIWAVLILSLALLPLGGRLNAQSELGNDSIVKMVKAGLSAEIITSMVKSQPGHYDMSPEGLIALKKSGVNDAIISAMIAHSAGAGASASGSGPDALGANGLPAGVDSVGMYYKDKDGNWTELGAEVVNFKTGGALKHIGTAGIVKGDLNGYVSGFHSHQPLPLPAELILYVPEGRSPGEYQLLRFRVNSDSREFRSMTGGVAHTKGGAERDTVEFTSKKIAPRVYAITLGGEVGKGEYGFLPPVEGSGKNIESSGKIYTFSFAQ
jgi:hypothetical protein